MAQKWTSMLALVTAACQASSASTPKVRPSNTPYDVSAAAPGACPADRAACAAADSAALRAAALAELGSRAPLEPVPIRADRSAVVVPRGAQTALRTLSLRTAPIADRVLVKISASEVSESFDRRLPGRTLLGLDTAFRGLSIRDAEYLGATREREVLVGLHLAQVDSLARIRAVVGRTGARLVGSPGQAGRGLTRTVAVLLDPGLGSAWLRRFEPSYEQLRPTSELRPLFRRLGVLSMRRVFRGVEKSVADRPQRVRVHRFADVLAAAKRAYPGRAARAYRRVDAWPSGSGPATLDLSTYASRLFPRTAIADRLAGQARTPEGYALSVPTNMENWFILRLQPGSNLGAALLALSRLRTVERVALDYPVTPSAVPDPEYVNQWGLKNTGTFMGTPGGQSGFDIDIEAAWPVAATGQPVVVGLIDTGLNPRLDELRNRLWSNSAEVGGAAGADDDCNGYIDDVHGITTYDRWVVDYGPAACGGSPGGASEIFSTHATSVGGVIAAEADNGTGIAGTAGKDNVQLMDIALGILGDRLFPPGFAEVAEALAYAISPSYDIGANVASLPPGADVVNMSFSASACQYLFEEILWAALDNGLILVGSAGNGDRRFVRSETLATGVFPASLPGVIAVGGATRMARRYAASNYGPGLDLVAPATEIRTITFDPVNVATQTVADVTTGQGTSYAAAFVSGAAAVILARYPHVTAPYMEHWLRAKARDMTDPNGDGVNDIGEDEWSGAGMLDVGRAVTTLSNPNDQPLDVAVVIERAVDQVRYGIDGFPPLAPLATGGSPDIGIRVQGGTLQNWALFYGQGDAPTAWVPVPVSGTITSLAQNFLIATAYGHTDVTGGVNPLDTDPLTNKQVYTLKLVAYNRAGTEFTAYDWFVPTRASVTFPEPNWTLRPDEGWLPLGGFVDARAGATYSVDIVNAADATIWTGTFPPPAASFPPWFQPTSASLGFTLMSDPAETDYPFAPFYPDVSAVNTDGWYKLRLRVSGSAGVDKDSVQVYVDRSMFPMRSWPMRHAAVPWGGGESSLADYPVLPLRDPWSESLVVLGASHPAAARLLVKTSKTVFALDQSGALVWEQRPQAGPPDHYEHRFSENIAVGDIDADGTREVVFAAYERRAADWENKLFIYAVNIETGQPMSDAWPLEVDGYGAHLVAVGDVTGDAKNEVIVALPRQYYVGVPSTSVSGPELRVYNHTGAELWRRTFPVELWNLGAIHIANVDLAGKDDIVVGVTGQILRGDNTFLTGWSTPATDDIYGSRVVVRATGERDVLQQSTSGLTLRQSTGAVRTGWPVTLPGPIAAGQIVPGGDPEIIVCGPSLSVLDVSGVRPATWSDVVLDGVCLDVTLADVDNDGAEEFVLLLVRTPATAGANGRVGAFLEAYELNGTRLGAADPRWPHPVPFVAFNWLWPMMHKQVTMGDVDGDGRPEIVEILRHRPWAQTYTAPSARIGVFDLP